jgi:DNA invertase Pin-like site-specific DNA recombinase
MVQHVAIYARLMGTEPELLSDYRQTVENRGDTVVATYFDDARITGRGKHAGWRNLLANLDAVDQIALSSVRDIPGKTVADLLKILAILRDHGVVLHLCNFDTGSTTCEVLDIIAAFRQVKLSQAIRAGQANAVAAGKRVGRPIVPYRIQERVRSALTEGGGIRPTARQFGVSPASVINIRRAMMGGQCTSC